MKNDIITNYTWNILKKQLQQFGVSNKVLYAIVDNVKEQLYSLIANWNDTAFRDAVLILGSEEGTFYEPKGGLIANMVVVAIRNSLLEGICSDRYREYGMDHYLKDAAIKAITGAAIEYFSKVNLEEVASSIKIEYDFYRETALKYPVAMHALMELAKCNDEDLAHDYIPLEITSPYHLVELDEDRTDHFSTVNYEDGISPAFNDSLLNLLKGIEEGESTFFISDSFKTTTRHFEKNLRILESILTHGSIFLTCNYLIANDHVSRRKKLLKACHGDQEFYDRLPCLLEVSEKYRSLIADLLQLTP